YNIEKLFYQIISKKKSPLKQGLSSASRLNSSLNFMVLTSKHGFSTHYPVLYQKRYAFTN
ncbi:hypothetical protein MKD04_17840, partial [[Clostridium] innocuum]|nr:hypothetical protein [[Clostridium] innocuum]MCR0262039.1 hypothetical protein [[Clostridium] innocuum]MCR0505270.1 hypothetical protein [[Clostridium] innocuum]